DLPDFSSFPTRRSSDLSEALPWPSMEMSLLVLLPDMGRYLTAPAARTPGNPETRRSNSSKNATDCSPVALERARRAVRTFSGSRSEEHTSELQSLAYLV